MRHPTLTTIAGRLVTETDPRDNDTTYSYDAVGQMTGIEDRNGREREFTYDDAGRLTAEDWLNASDVSIRTISYSYNDDNQLTGVTDPDATYAFTYDDDGRVTPGRQQRHVGNAARGADEQL